MAKTIRKNRSGKRSKMSKKQKRSHNRKQTIKRKLRGGTAPISTRNKIPVHSKGTNLKHVGYSNNITRMSNEDYRNYILKNIPAPAPKFTNKNDSRNYNPSVDRTNSSYNVLNRNKTPSNTYAKLSNFSKNSNTPPIVSIKNQHPNQGNYNRLARSAPTNSINSATNKKNPYEYTKLLGEPNKSQNNRRAVNGTSYKLPKKTRKEFDIINQSNKEELKNQTQNKSKSRFSKIRNFFKQNQSKQPKKTQKNTIPPLY